MVSIYCSNYIFLLLLRSDYSSPSFLNAYFNLLFASFSIHSATVLYLGGSGRLLELSLADPSLMTEKDSLLCILPVLFLLMTFSCLIKPSNSLTLGLHSMAAFSELLKRS